MTIRVTATLTDTGEEQTVEITDNYVLVREGTCYLEHTEVAGDGTNVLTVRGVKGRRTPPVRFDPIPGAARDAGAAGLADEWSGWDADTECDAPLAEHDHESCYPMAWWPDRSAVAAAVVRGLVDAGWTLTPPGSSS